MYRRRRPIAEVAAVVGMAWSTGGVQERVKPQ